MANERGFYVVITQDRISDLKKFLHFLLKFNNYPVYIVVADDKIDAHQKKTMLGSLSPFKTTVLIDTDILVNGKLDYLFEKAEEGFIGIYFEPWNKVYNTGVVSFPPEIKEEISDLWFTIFSSRVDPITRHFKVGKFNTYDQDVFNEILENNKERYKVFNLPREYNFILKASNPQEEANIFSNIKIFHFLHPTQKQNDPFKSFKIYHGAG